MTQEGDMSDEEPFEMPAYVIERVMSKRGRLRVFDRFEPAETALVVIDMQKFYIGDIAPALAVIPRINRLAQVMRQRGGLVAWVSMTVGENGKSLWPLYHDYFFTPAKGAQHRDQLTEGADGHKLHADLDARPHDIYARKKRFSAFLPGVSDLPAQLEARGIRNVAIAGMLTNFCCETSARDAMMLDYRVAMISDANAARYVEDHANGLTSTFQSFGDVVTTDEMIDEILKPAATGAVAAG
jgi:nicotinamidase-related amidase